MNFKSRYKDETKELSNLSSGISPKCSECQDTLYLSESEIKKGLSDGDLFEDPEFSRSSCDICCTNISGNRYIAHGICKKTKRIIHLDICEDCLIYMELGSLPVSNLLIDDM